VRFLAGEAGIRQFLDVGTGLPTVDNTHEVAQRVAPDSRIVYVDNDPLVLTHARALLTSTPQGATDYVDADLREPDQILAAAARTLDFDQPVALMLLGIVGHMGDYDQARSIVKRLLDAVPSGSYLALDDGTNVVNRAVVEQAQELYNQSGAIPYHPRSPSRSLGSSRGWSCSSPAWCRARGGGQTPSPAVACPQRSTCSAASAASHSPGAPQDSFRISWRMSAALRGGAARTLMVSMTCRYWLTSSRRSRYSALVRCST
jgi:O-methyltransferase involved in polyketide biosynthesis